MLSAMVEDRTAECAVETPRRARREFAVEAVLVLFLIFFRDPLTAQPHEPDVSALMRVCDVHRIPLATNVGTAEAVVDWLRDTT
jgi:methylglyoxal synthase